MSRLLSLLDKLPLTLIVNLPENSIELAKAAEEGGADALTVPIDPSVKDKKQLISIVDTAKVPVGARLRGDISEDEVIGLKKLGVDFIDFDLTGAAAWMLKLTGVGKIATLDSRYIVEDLTRLSDRPINGIDAAIVPDESIGRDLMVGDLQEYITICLSTGLPVIVPTQKLIRISEVPIIWDTGAKGILLTDIVTGTSSKSLKAVTKEFKEAIKALEE